MKYFEFQFNENQNGKVINQGSALCYSISGVDLSAMKKTARKILKNSSGVITITETTEISRRVYVQKGGNPNVY